MKTLGKTPLIAIRYENMWTLTDNVTIADVTAAPPPGATQVLTDTWEVIDL